MDNIQTTDKNNKFFDRRLIILSLIAFFIFVWIIIIVYVSDYVKSEAEANWEKVAYENTEIQKSLIVSNFETYQNDVIKLSDRLTSSSEFKKYIQRSDSKKLFEEMINLNLNSNYQIETYNSRLELLAFTGRRLESDIFSMQKCLNKNKFSVIKEVGFYTFLIVYSPVFDTKDNAVVTGIVLTSRIIDINYQINNKFFRNVGLLNDINKSSGINPVLLPANIISGKIDFDSSLYSGQVYAELKGIDGSKIGLVFFPKYNSVSHFRKIDALKSMIVSMLVFGLSVVLFLIFLKFLFRVKSPPLKFILVLIAVSAIRFVWLEFNFPSKTFNLEIFSPGFYANTFGFGISKSLGELFITSLFILAISIYGLRLSLKKIPERFEIRFNMPLLKGFFTDILLVIISFGVIYSFGQAIQSIIFDSNIKLFDKAGIIPASEQFFIYLVILILGFSLCLILTAIYSIILKKYIGSSLSDKKIKKYKLLSAIFIPPALICYIADKYNYFNLDSINLLIIIVLNYFFAAYLCYKLFSNNKYNPMSLKNFSILMLFCIILVPGLLIEKIIKQETQFVEIIGKKISDKEYDKIKFILLTELSELSESRKLETGFKNKLPELAFSVWADSKFSEENFNTSIAILDTNKKLISDFAFNTFKLNSDSIIKYASDNYFSKIKKQTVPADTLVTEDSLNTGESFESEEDYSAEETETETDIILQSDNITILDNRDEEYYLGILPVEIIDLKNTKFARIIGYLLAAVEYESNSFIVSSSMQLFKNYSKDNLFDKLISDPVITEYVNDEVVSSTNPDLSKSNKQSLDAFRESVKNKTDKSNWRYENVNNEKFKTYYVLSAERGTGNQRIISISLKRNDFKLIAFFYLKFILFAMFIYVFTFTVISLILLVKIRNFRFYFREKLFASFFIVSVIPIILLAVYTRSFIKDKYDNNFRNQIISDLNLVSQTLKSNQFIPSGMDSLKQNRRMILGKSSTVTDKNFNLFLRTNLVSTTNEELYKSDLLDTRVDAEAYFNIIFLKKDFFSKTEEIGEYSFITGFKPYFDRNNNLAGLMSSQTLYRQNEINEELTEILTFIFGTYIIVIILLLVFVTFLTHRISKPILQLQNATEKISLGEKIIELDNERKDEIGDLINSFNKMTKELESSKVKLKKAEREAAWRDIARRVAHEIKNPLTPMKLSIQHLYDVYFNGKKDFPDTLKKTRNIIINEIDNLNRIATEFSDFAKLSGRNFQKTGLNKIIEEVVSLYKIAPDIEFNLDLDSSIHPIRADRQELNRVFQNLIKNSIQAIEENGIINIKTYSDGEFIFAEITDNGSGIDEKTLSNLFEPNFSTKSTGMGLGLSIIKKSLDDMNAEISFSSRINEGTRVTLKFIPYNPKNENNTA